MGGGLPARALGVSWGRASISAFVGHLVAATLVFGTPWRPFDSWAAYLGIELSLAAVVASLFWTNASRRSALGQLSGFLLPASCVAFGGISGGVFSLSIGFLTWILLPAVVGPMTAQRA